MNENKGSHEVLPTSAAVHATSLLGGFLRGCILAPEIPDAIQHALEEAKSRVALRNKLRRDCRDLLEAPAPTSTTTLPHLYKALHQRHGEDWIRLAQEADLLPEAGEEKNLGYYHVANLMELLSIQYREMMVLLSPATTTCGGTPSKRDLSPLSPLSPLCSFTTFGGKDIEFWVVPDANIIAEIDAEEFRRKLRDELKARKLEALMK